jgi:hypothetical protein
MLVLEKNALRLAVAFTVAVISIACLVSCHGGRNGSSVTVPAGTAQEAYFVAPWGSDSAPGTIRPTTLVTLKRVAQLAQPGDTILLRGGVYDTLNQHVYIEITMNGTPNAPITIKSYPGERAIFDGHKHPWHPRYENDGNGLSDPNLIRVIGDHLIWEDITFRNGVGRGFYFVGYHNTLRHIESHHHHHAGIYFQGSHNLLEYVTAHDNNSIANGGNSGNGISLVDGNHIRATHGTNAETRGNIIRYALLYKNSDDGIGVWNSWDTLIEHSISYQNGIGPTGNGRGFKLGGAGRQDIGTIARFNIAYENKNNFDTNGSTGVLLYNNTSLNSPGAGYILTHHASNACANEAYNNISYGDTHPRARGDCTIHTHNSWPDAGNDAGGNLAIQDPKFVTLDTTSPDFATLQPNSPAINAGRDMGFAFMGPAPDLGARESGGDFTTGFVP